MSPTYPSGTVTFLFTDIENSTKLWEQHPQKMIVVQARHNQILREAIESNNGYTFQVIGDSFCAAFDTAGEAIRAAVQSQQDLHHETRDGPPIKVRMGIHTGKAEIQSEDGLYDGYMTLSRVQRLMSAGRGDKCWSHLPHRNLSMMIYRKASNSQIWGNGVLGV